MIDLSPGLIGAAICLPPLLNKYGVSSRKKLLDSAPFIQGTSTSDVLEFSELCGLLEIHDGRVQLTKLGAKFGYQEFSLIEAKRVLLFHYIKFAKPSWSSLLTRGRMESFPLFHEDIKACFSDADLMSEPTREIVLWWDSISNIVYGQRSKLKNSVGRYGEILTLEYETQRTGKPSKWQALESNLSGYDILSVVDQYNSTPLLIEVKASQSAFVSSLAYITRHEWEIAKRSAHYVFYFWSIYNGRHRLATLSKDDILNHIPQNTGNGHWETFSLNYSAFKNKFIEIDTSFYKKL